MNLEQGAQLMSIIQGALVFVVGLWAIIKFRKQRTHYPHIEFSVDCNIYESPDDKKNIAEFLFLIKNQGFVQQKFEKIILTVRISDPQKKKLWIFHDFTNTHNLGTNSYQRLSLPIKLLDNIDIVPEYYRPYVVEPSCEEKIRYITPIPSSIQYMLIHAEYTYPELVKPNLDHIFFVFKLANYYIRKVIRKIWKPGYPTRNRTTEKFILVDPIRAKAKVT